MRDQVQNGDVQFKRKSWFLWDRSLLNRPCTIREVDPILGKDGHNHSYAVAVPFFHHLVEHIESHILPAVHHLLAVKQDHSRLGIWVNLILTVDTVLILPRCW